MTRPRLEKWLCLALALGWAACAEEPKTAVQLVLTPDPDLADATELLESMERIEVVVDAKDGLRGVTQAGPLPSGGTAIDWDSDGQLEVRFSSPLLSHEALPVLELGLDENSDRDLAFRVLGFPAQSTSDPQQAVGQGGASARVPRGEVRRVGAPFNSTPWSRPPRVLLMLPQDGAVVWAPLAGISLVLTTTVKAAILDGHVRLTAPGGSAVPVTVTAQTLVVSGNAFSQEQRSLLSVDFAELTQAGRYALQIGPGLESTAGRRFDQDPSTPAEDPFVSHFDFRPSYGGGRPCSSCPEGYTCNEAQSGCVPILTCQGGCLAGWVCDEGEKQCREDCRVQEFCFATSATCETKTGLCR